jgi:hypothetical protein
VRNGRYNCIFRNLGSSIGGYVDRVRQSGATAARDLHGAAPGNICQRIIARAKATSAQAPQNRPTNMLGLPGMCGIQPGEIWQKMKRKTITTNGNMTLMIGNNYGH